MMQFHVKCVGGNSTYKLIRADSAERAAIKTVTNSRSTKVVAFEEQPYIWCVQKWISTHVYIVLGRVSVFQH